MITLLLKLMSLQLLALAVLGYQFSLPNFSIFICAAGSLAFWMIGAAKPVKQEVKKDATDNRK